MKSRTCNRAKRVSRGCRNHGTCPHCTGSRTHANRRAEPADEEEQRAATYPRHACPCGEMATWWYAPGQDERYRCDACVPRGCSCQDDEREPCCEWVESEGGFDG